MKVAYVEDDKGALAIFSEKLKRDGIQCDVYYTGEHALSCISAGSYDVLIVDIRLPHLSGTHLLQKLREKSIHIPCILITAFNNLNYSREAFDLNASYLLEKPFTYKTLRKILDSVFESPGKIQHFVDRGLAKLILTERENQIARYLLKGLSNAEIGRLLKISEKTVKHFITLIFEKSGVTSRSEFFSYIFPV